MKKPASAQSISSELFDGPGRKLNLGGKRYWLRPLNEDDLERLRAFFYSHSVDTILQRYGYAISQMTRERAHELVGVDQSRDLALAIFETRGNEQIIHAVGRYCLDPDGRGAEVAFVVRETKRRLGMGRTLFETLREVARERGLDYLWGRVRRDNAPMLGLFRREGAEPVRATAGADGDVDMRIDLRNVARPTRTRISVS